MAIYRSNIGYVTPLLDLYVLSLLDRNINTPYLLQREGGLSLGASTPSLRRLGLVRLVKRHDEKGTTNRPRHVYTLTATGVDLARNGWREYLYAGRIPNDLDGVLRLAEMATHYGATSNQVVDLLNRASEERKTLSKRAAANKSSGQGFSYQQMRSICDKARWRAEGEALTELAASVIKLPARKKRTATGGSAPLRKTPR